MTSPQDPINCHDDYHAHLYFDAESLAQARLLCGQIQARFGLMPGRLHQRPVGPHPAWSCQIKFSRQDFDQLIPWLRDNRQGLSVLIHAVTGDDLKDHSDYAYWLGDSLVLNLAIFQG